MTLRLLSTAASLVLTIGHISVAPDSLQPPSDSLALGSLSFTGKATNRGYPTFPAGPTTAAIELTVGEEAIASGRLTIQPPLGGGGSVNFYRWADSVFFLSFSPGGDTIAWLGATAGGSIQGEYRVVGGQSAGQWGDWKLSQVGGSPYNALPRPRRPIPDSVNLATLGTPAQSPELWLPPEIRDASTPAPSRADSDTGPVLLHPRHTTFTLSIGTFGPCERSFDTRTRVALLYCPKVSEPDGREYIQVSFLLPRIWADSFSAEVAALQLSQSELPGLITESAFQAPAQPSDTSNAFFIAQTYVALREHAGTVYLNTVAPLKEAVTILSFSTGFQYPNASLRPILRSWLIGNAVSYSQQLGRLRIDSAWIDDMATLAR